MVAVLPRQRPPINLLAIQHAVTRRDGGVESTDHFY
jgi:hypothetical protein